MSRTNLTRLTRRALAVAVLAAAAIGSGTTTAVVDWVAAHDMIDVPYVRDCRGILRQPEECPSRPRTGADLGAALTGEEGHRPPVRKSLGPT
jgi:hypothetical protein